MTAPSVVPGYTTGSYTTNGTSRTINTPTHASGQVIYIVYASDGNGDTASISGFSTVYSNISISGEGVVCVFKKTAGGSEPGSYTIVNTVSEKACAIAWAVDNDGGVNFTGTAQTGSGATITVPAVTTSVADCLRISIGASEKDTRPFGTASGHSVMGNSGAFSGGAITVQYKTIASPSTDASATISMTSDTWAGLSFAIAPASSPTVYEQDVDGGLTPAGSLVKRLSKILAGGLTPSGILGKLASKILAGAVTPSGTVSKRTAKNLGGTVGSAGSLTGAKVAYKPLDGEVGPYGVLYLAVGKVLAATIAPSGGLLKRLGKVLEGTVGSSGVLAITRFVSLEGILQPLGDLVKGMGKSLAGAVTPSGTLVKTSGKILSGTVSISGSLTKLIFSEPVPSKPRGTIFSSGSLSFSFQQAPWSSDSLIRDVTQEVSSFDYSIAAVGGFWTANLGMKLPLEEIEDWLYNGIGRQIICKGGASTVVWEGIVNRVSLEIGGYDISIGPYMDISNKIKITYSMFIQVGDGTATGVRVETDYIQDDNSILRYGTLEKNFSVGGIAQEEVSDLQAMLLERFKDPLRSEDLTIPGSTGNRIIDVKLECIGFSFLLQKYVYNSDTTGLQNLSDKLEAILQAEPNGLLTSMEIEENTLQVPAFENDDNEAWGLVKELVAKGVSGSGRTVFGVYANRKAIYRSVTNEIVYIRPLREGASVIQDASGGLLQAWQIRPGTYALITDMLPGRPINTSSLPEEIRAIFVETVQYRMPDSLILNGSHSFRLDQKIAQLGISGIR